LVAFFFSGDLSINQKRIDARARAILVDCRCEWQECWGRRRRQPVSFSEYETAMASASRDASFLLPGLSLDAKKKKKAAVEVIKKGVPETKKKRDNSGLLQNK
jgi:hypothetical protein